MVGAERVGGRAADGLGFAQDRPTQRLSLEGVRLREVEHAVVRRIGGLGDLLADDALLALEVGRIEGRMAYEVAQDVHGERQAALQATHLEAGPLIAGGGVDMAALLFDRLDDISGRAASRALEHHVFEQMRPAVVGLVLPPRAASDHDGQGQALKPGHGVAHDPDAIVQAMHARGGQTLIQGFKVSSSSRRADRLRFVQPRAKART